MANFVTYQSPYVMADNNPIYFVDEYGFGKCGWLCRTVNRILYGEKNLNTDGRRLYDPNRGKGHSRGTGLAMNGKKPKGKKPSGNEGCSDCGSTRSNINLPDFDLGNSGIGQVDGPDFGPILAEPKETPAPKREIIFEIPTARQSLTTPVNIRFTGTQGTILNRNHPVSQRTLDALLFTLTADPNLTIEISSNYFTTTPLFPNVRQRGTRQNSARANAIRAFLERNGIAPSRISIGEGTLNQQTHRQQTAGQRSNQNIKITNNAQQ